MKPPTTPRASMPSDPIFTRVEALLAKLDCGQAFLAWGRITSSFGLVGQALAAFEAAGKHFDSAGLHYQWGRALLDADQPSAALERLWMARTRSTEPGNTALLEWIDGDIARAQLARTPDHDLLRLAITRLRDLERHTTSPVARFWARFSAAAGFDQHGSIDQALEGYHALDLEFPAHPFPIHNTWSIRSQQGQYSAAEDSRKKALAKYEALYEDWRRSLTPGDATLRLPELGSEGQNPFEEASGFTYYAWCLLPEVASSDPKAAERTRQLVMRLCRQGQRMNSNHVPLLTVLVRLHLDKEVGGVEHATDAERAESFVAHRRAIETMRAQLESFPVARVYAALGHLHLLSGDVEAASTALKKAVELDPSSSESHTRLGAALARADDHPKAIRQFEAALSCRPSNLDASSNLAESCLKVGDRARARKEYESILRLAPQHIESLIGLSELEVAEGDSLRAIDPQAALAAQARAAGRLKRVLECCRNGHGSKRLSAKEIGDVEYSLGYIAAMQYEVSGRADDGLLQEALERFKEVPARHASSEKAAAAIARIEERTSRVRSLLSIESLGPVLAAALALLVFLTTQVFQLVRVEWVPSHYALGAPALAELIAAGVDVKTLEELGALAGAATADARLDRSELVRALEKALGSKRAAKYGKAILKVAKVESGFHAVRPVAPEIYLMLTFGSLLFMIAGLYMRHVLKLKIGPIELEKAALDQITAPSSLNISR